MRLSDREPMPYQYETYEEWEKAHESWEDAMDDYCEQYIEEHRGLR